MEEKNVLTVRENVNDECAVLSLFPFPRKNPRISILFRKICFLKKFARKIFENLIFIFRQKNTKRTRRGSKPLRKFLPSNFCRKINKKGTSMSGLTTKNCMSLARYQDCPRQPSVCLTT